MSLRPHHFSPRNAFQKVNNSNRLYASREKKKRKNVLSHFAFIIIFLGLNLAKTKGWVKNGGEKKVHMKARTTCR